MTRRTDPDTGSAGQIRPLIVYGREECHLCQEMISALQAVQQQKSLTFKIIDIDSDSGLSALYGEKIPVLVSADTRQEICHFSLDLAALDDYLAKFR